MIFMELRSPTGRSDSSRPNPGTVPIDPASRLFRNGIATKTRYNSPKPPARLSSR